MMQIFKRFIASVKKEFLVLSRDRAGLAVLYIMPVVLIVVMVLIQENTFRTIRFANIPVILVNDDAALLGETIDTGLIKSNVFPLIREYKGTRISADSASILVSQGIYKLAVVIQDNATERLNDFVRLRMSGQIGDSSLIKDTIRLYYDPAINMHYKNALKLAVSWSIQNAENMVAIQDMMKMMPSAAMASFMQTAMKKLAESSLPDQYIHEQYETASENFLPNSVQHNVPAWSMFAMFFIVIPLAGSIIKEREEGSFQRLMTMPVSLFELFAGKLAVYLAVCISQFAILVAIGLYLFPLMDYPRLIMGTHLFALIVVILASAFAAIGYGMAVGMFASTHQQASSFGAISVIIAAAVGGIWVPVFIMPGFMQHVSKISPLNWGLNAFHDLFLRNAGLKEVLAPSLFLIVFAVFTVMFALVKLAGNKK